MSGGKNSSPRSTIRTDGPLVSWSQFTWASGVIGGLSLGGCHANRAGYNLHGLERCNSGDWAAGDSHVSPSANLRSSGLGDPLNSTMTLACGNDALVVLGVRGEHTPLDGRVQQQAHQAHGVSQGRRSC